MTPKQSSLLPEQPSGGPSTNLSKTLNGKHHRDEHFAILPISKGPSRSKLEGLYIESNAGMGMLREECLLLALQRSKKQMMSKDQDAHSGG